MKNGSSDNVAIVTIESPNYGNRLQNYALQETLSALGYRAETLRRQVPDRSPAYFARKVVQSLLSTKGKKFRDFDKKIRKSRYCAGADHAPDALGSSYRFFIAGSDQIWNPHYDFVGAVDFLTFAPAQKRIAYAASFGVSGLPDDVKTKYAEYLSGFRAVSVRETSGADIIRALTGKESEVVLDPTLMLTKEKWHETERKPRAVPDGKYVLVYALGEKNEQFSKAVRESEATVIDVQRIMPDGREWAVGPMEFLWLIDHAEMVLTDSFHCTAFSVLFHTRFQVFDRPGISMNARIITLLRNLGMPEDMDPMNTGDQLLFDFDAADRELERLRNRSFRYLKEALRSNPE